jgi:hypothetical protein
MTLWSNYLPPFYSDKAALLLLDLSVPIFDEVLKEQS